MIKKVIILLGMTLCLAGAPVQAEEKVAPPPPEFEYLQIPLMVPIITDQGLTQQVSLSVSLELPYGSKEDVDVFKPRLMDAYIRDLFGAMGAGQIMIRGNIVDVELLRTRLAAVTTRVVGEGKVNDVLLQFVQQYAVRG